MITKFKKPVAASGSTIENEPIIKSDGASSDLMEWQASTGSSTVKIREGSGNTVVLDVDGSLELADKIKSVTSATTVGAVFIYDTSADSDSGKWRKKCKGLSWFDEASSATRSARSQFPSIALIVADNVSDTETLTIYDLDNPAMEMWMQFTVTTQASPYHDFWRDGRDVTSIAALNGRLYFGTTEAAGGQVGLKVVDFVNDRLSNRNTGVSLEWNGYFDANVANRNSATKIFSGNTFSPIVFDIVNDVAATVLEGAEIGALGLPIPTVAVACGSGGSGGISWIHPNGDVYDSTAYGQFDTIDTFGKDEWVGSQFAGTEVVRIFKTAYADGHTEHASREYAATSTPAILDGDPVIASTSDGIAAGTANGLTLIKDNPATSAGSAVAHITNDYNTGYMLGDIRGAWLAYGISCGHSHADHVQTAFSVKANTLTETGTLTKTAVATGADLTGFSGWSADNYLSRASDTDFDFGTGDFSIMFWVKSAASSVYEDYMARIDSSYEAGDWLMEKNTTGLLGWFQGASLTTVLFTTQAVSTEWKLFAAVRRSGVFNWYIDGKLDASVADTTSYTPSGGSALTIGKRYPTYTSYPALNASFSLLRISATAPTPSQIKAIFDEEKPLFAANAKCLLQSASDTDVSSLAYDKSTDLLHVSQTATTNGESIFRGLECVDTFSGQSHGWSYGSQGAGSAAGGVVARNRPWATGGVLVDLPALDVRAELNQGDDKLPDDGKFHFSGVTVNATPVDIGQIPIAENEQFQLVARVAGVVYGDLGHSNRIDAEIKQPFNRPIGDNVTDEGVMSSLIEQSAAEFDVVLEKDTSAQTVGIKVTGSSALRMQWTASVEVQRISDKTYER